MASPLKKAHYLTGMLVFGTCTAITMKMQLVMMCTGYGGVEHTFDKPFFQSIAMFASMALALPVSWVGDCISKKRASKKNMYTEPLIDVNIQTAAEKKKKTNPLIIAIPASFDLIASTMMTYGLIYVSVSIFQMLRGSMVIFSTILSRIFLPGRRVATHQLIGIITCFIALCIVGTAGFLIPQPQGDTSATSMAIGISLVILSQIVQAGQIVTEEFLLKDLTLSPLSVVGFEGLWGTLLMIFIACPIAYVVPGADYSPMKHNSLENTIDSFICLASSKSLIIAVLLFCGAVFLYNCYGMLITDSFSAINRTIFEAVRTAVVWIVSLVIHAIEPDSPYGELWNKYSFVELAGFILLFISSLIYNGVIKLPCVHSYESPADKSDPEAPATPEN